MSNFLKMLLSFICFLFVTIFAEVGATANECVISRCSHHGPAIRFPFWLKDSQPDHCGYPGFQVILHRKASDYDRTTKFSEAVGEENQLQISGNLGP